MGKGRTGRPPGRWRGVNEKFLVEERFMDAPARRNLYRLAVALVIAGALLFTIILAGVLQQEGFSAGDEPTRSWLLALRSEFWTAVMIVLAVIFGPVGLPIIVLVVTVVWSSHGPHALRPRLLLLLSLRTCPGGQ